MTRHPSASRWLLLAAYPMVGLALGLADPALGQLAQQLGTKPGAATAVSVNLLMPLAAVILSLAMARLWSAWLGACTLTLGLYPDAGLLGRSGTPLPYADPRWVPRRVPAFGAAHPRGGRAGLRRARDVGRPGQANPVHAA
jgi:hypothetical protein